MATDSAQQLAPGQRLAKGSLTLPDAIAISVSVIAPGMAMFLNVPGVAIVAGGSTPLAFLLGGIGCLALAFVVIGFTRRMASAGYAYTYASRSLGKSAGFMAGWLYAFGLACFVPMTMAGVAYLFCDLVGLDATWNFPLFLIGMVLLVILSIVRIKVTTRLQLLVGIVTVAVIIVVNLVTTVKGGAHGNTAAPFTFSHTVSGGFHGVFYGIILGVTSYIGFETAADFGEETKNPRRSIPIAIIAATTFAILFYLWTTYSMAIGDGVNKLGSDGLPLKTIADRYLASWVGTLTEVGAMLSAFIVCVALRDGVDAHAVRHGPRGRRPHLARPHPPAVQDPRQRHDRGRPGRRGDGSGSAGFGFGPELGPTPLTTYYFWATIGTLVVIVVYIALCFGGMVFFRRTKRQWEPGRAPGRTAHRRGCVRRRTVRVGLSRPGPSAELHALHRRGLDRARPDRAGRRARHAPRRGRTDRVDPRRGGRRGCRRPGPACACRHGRPHGVVTGRVPLLDDHAHPFPLTAEPLDLGSLSLSVDPADHARRAEAAPHRLMLEMLRGRLATLLGCAPAEVTDARAEAARDWPAYLRRLFDDVGIGGLLLDGGPAVLSPADVSRYAGAAGRPMWSLLRLEAVIDPLLQQGADGPSIEAALATRVEDSAAAGVAGLKTVIAYRTGLAVDPTVSAQDAYRSVASTDPAHRRAKPLRDYLLRRTFGQCADLGLPIQIHTGFGDSEIRLATARPVLLDDLLRTPEGAAAKVVLIHAGYPWHEELAYLACVRRNVWAEMSLVNLFSPMTTADRVLRMLDLAPIDRVLFGTDGHGAPETHWFAGSVLRTTWDEVVSRLSGAVRPSWLSDGERLVFHDNATTIYRLDNR